VATIPVQGSNPSIGQVFDQKGLWKWWEQNKGIGTNPFNGVTEKGMDYSSLFGTFIGVPVAGTILRIVHNDSSVGDVVELQAGDGSVWLYQHITAKVKVNQTLGVGGVIGTENGLPVDQYSTGPHIEVRYCQPGQWNPGIDSWNEPWINPYPIFSGLTTQSAGKVDPGSWSLTNLPKPPITLAPNADVTDALIALDQLCAFTNPFDTSNNNVTQDKILGSTFDDPMSWMAAVGSNFIGDMRSFVVRFLLVAVGALLMYKAVSGFIDVGKIADAGASLGKLALMGV
jgi:hypothetical protein